jgi:hypothetical protein
MLKKIRNLLMKRKELDKTMSVCSCCGKEVYKWPAIGYKNPSYYDTLTDDEKSTVAKVSSDFCVIEYPDETNFFISCVLFQSIIDCKDELNYGLWVSLSRKSFEDYRDNYNEQDREGTYFGWISNNMEGYSTTLSIPANVVLGKNGNRPEVIPHESFDHPFVRDYYNGISIQEAHIRIEKV